MSKIRLRVRKDGIYNGWHGVCDILRPDGMMIYSVRSPIVRTSRQDARQDAAQLAADLNGQPTA
jgi:hypothetical protein